MRNPGKMNINVHFPTSTQGMEELTRRVSEVHALAIVSFIQSLNCPTEQKHRLLDVIRDDVSAD